MCLASDPPTRPELSRGTCEVWDGDRWAIQNTVTVMTAVCAFESMLDVKIFCAEECRALQEKLSLSLKRSANLLAINPDKVEEGEKQLDTELLELDNKLISLRIQEAEQLHDEVDGEIDETEPPDFEIIDTPSALYCEQNSDAQSSAKLGSKGVKPK
jgi:hypothetical protein